ncbi:MAG: 3-hydroxyacyl-CoA dehydrogenase [Legionellales bacterium]|nr:3-hydroxyacyl-CoA dehydrogenase [Legionellales bacterium]|tara:strand:- start:2436 stop:3194 length:759 start_codon:yes stop_codon:yes gene_type:complete
MEISGQVALVTGAASGMGAACAAYLSEHGAKVAMLDLNADLMAEQVKKYNALSLKADVSDPKAIEKALDTIEKQWDAPARIVVHCAGIVEGQRVLSKKGPYPLEDFSKVININLIGTFNVLRLCAHRMTQNSIDSEDQGVMIQTASIAAFEGQIGQAAYSASKGAVAAMTLPIARELARYGVRVMTIAPGLVETPMMESIPEDIRDDLIEHVAFPKRLAKPQEFARLVAHIIENSYLNGEIIRLDGGLRMLA